MSDEVFSRVADLLNTIPNGFPRTKSGVEIELLKKIFTEEEAELETKLKLYFETPASVASRTGLTEEYCAKKLQEMSNKGQILGVLINGTNIYRLMPFVFGIYEYQVTRMDREFAELADRYWEEAFGEQFHSFSPSLMKVVPVEEEIPSGAIVEPFERISALIEGAKAWAVGECICKKEKGLVGKKCSYPLEVCLGIAPIEGYFDNFFWGRAISKEEALAVMEMAEEAGLVHLTSNIKEGQFYICNCCPCCCGVLTGITQLNYKDAVARSNYRATIDKDTCAECGTCAERCPIHAIDSDTEIAVSDLCIGCGLCVSSCPAGALSLVKKLEAAIEEVPQNQKEWMKLRSQSRGNDEYLTLLKKE